MLWCDHQDCLKLITLSESHLPGKTPDSVACNLDLQSFVVKNENVDLIRTYVKHLIHENITERRNPLLFSIARANIMENIKDNSKLNEEIRHLLASLSKGYLLNL